MAKKIDFSVQGMDILGLDKMNAKEQKPEATSTTASEKKEPQSKQSLEHKEQISPPYESTISARLIIPQKKETKSSNKMFRLKPSIAMKATLKADKLGISLNEVVNQLLLLWSNEED